MSSSAKIDNKKDILILGNCPIQGLEHTLSAEKMYLFVNGKEIQKGQMKQGI